MKGIETQPHDRGGRAEFAGSDHCPAMKGIETRRPGGRGVGRAGRSDHCPAMKGIETIPAPPAPGATVIEATTAPQ